MIPASDFGGHDFSDGNVNYAWQMPAGHRQHVLVNCETPNVFLVLVLDLTAGEVLGHYLLDIYGV